MIEFIIQFLIFFILFSVCLSALPILIKVVGVKLPMDKQTKRYWSFLRNGLRRMSLKYPTRFDILKNARRPYRGANKRQKWKYKCNGCKKWFKATEIQVDHIKPCGELTDPKHIKGFVLTLFCEEKNLQILCKPCHVRKTAGE